METVLAAVRAFGVDVDRASDAPRELANRRAAAWQRMIEPVIVAWDGRVTRLRLRLPDTMRRTAPPSLRLTPDGESERDVTKLWRVPSPPRRVRGEQIGRHAFVEVELPVDASLPPGYHRLEVEATGRRGSALVISAPGRMPAGDPDPMWGVLLPLYALRTERSWGVGDLTDLESLMEWVSGLGGRVAATLPMLASFLGDRPYDHSPYSPASKLFWNELYLDVTNVPELQRSPEARAVLESQALRDEVAALRSEPLVDYRRAMAVKRGVLQTLARAFFADPGPRAKEFRAFVRTNPRLDDYASFRANCERWNDPWQVWPHPERNGSIPPRGGNEDAYRYHRYVQWLMAEQMEHVDGRARELGTGLYFDVPIGVNPDSYDVWRERPSFVSGVSAGAPPDPFFTGGQDWGFPPLHPERIREDGYAYPIATLRHLLRHAGVLRIDHVMGLHRLFWVPHGAKPDRGVYVRYRAEEWYAILALESRINETLIVGEDLGVVPRHVRPALRRHGVLRSYVVQMELAEHPAGPLEAPPPDALAALNTHDMPPFAGFWEGHDLDTRLAQGWLDPKRLTAEQATRRRQRETIAAALRRAGWLSKTGGAPSERSVVRAALEYLAAGPARMVVVNLEDLWAQREPQNVPGTTTQYPNWRRPARYSLEEIRQLPAVRRVLRSMDAARRGGGRGPHPR
jgi:4-alpha-glucanotransferase